MQKNIYKNKYVYLENYDSENKKYIIKTVLEEYYYLEQDKSVILIFSPHKFLDKKYYHMLINKDE